MAKWKPELDRSDQAIVGDYSDMSTLEVVLVELSRVFEPLGEAVDEGEVRRFVVESGIGDLLVPGEIDAVIATLEDLESDLQTLEAKVLSPIKSGDFGGLASNLTNDYEVIFTAVQGIFDGVQELSNLNVQSVDPEQVADQIVDYLLIEYLSTYRPGVYNTLAMVGLLEEDGPPEIYFSRIPKFLEQPLTILVEAFDWGKQSFKVTLVTYYLREFLYEFGIHSNYVNVSKPYIEDLADTTYSIDSEEFPDLLQIPFLSFVAGGDSVTVGIRIAPLPGEPGTSLPGLAVAPFGLAQGSSSFDLGDGWTFNTNASVQQADWGISVRPDISTNEPTVNLLGAAEGEPTINASVELAYDGATGEKKETVLLGSPEASRLSIKHAQAKGSLTYDDGDTTFKAELPAKGTIGAHPDDFDNFLSAVLPAGGLFYNFDATLGWSSTEGLYFERGGSLETSIPQQSSLGPVTLKEVYLAITPDGQQVTLEGAASGSLAIGPVTATFRRMGVAGDVSFPQNRSGDLGPLDIQKIGFKPPEGIGVSIDAGSVTGGGYIGFDPANNRYSGILNLQIGDLSITAVGLLTTELPGGADGYSFLIMIAGEFSPVQLGFGFTLNGVGGLFGLHRGLNVSPLRKAVRTGSMDTVLFPENPVANAKAIISRLRKTFPPTKDHYVFGPMVKIGWGTPTLITLDLGVVLELPTWKIVVLGRISAELPDEQAPMIVLNMDVLGVIRPEEKRVAIDATLYDSRVAQWALSGDMALRSKGGDDPRFVLSVGGFHPRFEPPKNFPELDRVRLTLGNPDGNPKIEIRGYFAVTSNTVQVGAGVHVLLEAGPARVTGHLAIDALFHFDPFKFIVDFLASLTIEAFGFTVSAKIDGSIAGPTPYRVKGEVHVELSKLYSVDQKFNVTLGPTKQKESLPKANVLTELGDALSKPGNWSAQRPSSGAQIVSLRKIEPGPKEVLTHPLGEIAVRQTVVPLNDFHIEKFGNATPSPYTRFAITDASTTAAATSIQFGQTVREKFAPAQYTKMSDKEKLDSSGFESHAAGRQMSSTGVYAGWEPGSGDEAANTRSTSLTYEMTYIDREKNNYGTLLPKGGAVTYTPDLVDALSRFSPVTNADTSTTGMDQYTIADQQTRQVSRGDVTDVPGGDGVDADDVADTVVASSDDGTRSGARRATAGTAVADGGASTGTNAGGLAASLSISEPEYVVVSADDQTVVGLDTAPRGRSMSKSEARRALSRHVEANPEDAGEYRVMAAHKARNATVAPVEREPVEETPEIPDELQPPHLPDLGDLEPVEPTPSEPGAEAPPVAEAGPTERVRQLLWSVERHSRTAQRRLDDLATAIDEDDDEGIRSAVEERPTVESYATAIGRNTFEPLARALQKLTAEPRAVDSRTAFTTEEAERALAQLREDYQELLAAVESVAGDLRADSVTSETRQEVGEARAAIEDILSVVEDLRASVDRYDADREGDD